jgi:hypothetical protein
MDLAALLKEGSSLLAAVLDQILQGHTLCGQYRSDPVKRRNRQSFLAGNQDASVGLNQSDCPAMIYSEAMAYLRR